MKYFLSIDQGTSSTRAILFDTEGNIVESRQDEIKQIYPSNGWVEHCAEEIWQKTDKAIKQIIELYPNKILACGITNQRETVVAWDKETGTCLYNAIVWQDRRTLDFCQTRMDFEPVVIEKTGLLLDPYFSATKIRWILESIPAARRLLKQQRLAIGTIDSFLCWRLTQGEHFVTDVTNASRTMLFNIETLQWDQELLDFFNIPIDVLPQVKSCCDDFGVIKGEKGRAAIPITAIVGDQQSASIGQACFKPGMIKSTYGTGCFLMLNTGDKRPYSNNRLLTTIAYAIDNKIAYSLEGSIFNAGTAVKWLRDELQLIRCASETEELARSLSDNGGVYMVPAFTGLGAPHWDAKARASIIGLQRDSGKAHLARAVLESVCYQTKDILMCMRDDSGFALDYLRVDGGMVVNDWLLQFLSDSCQVLVQRPNQIETTALGAALLAALGSGYCSSIEQVTQRFWQLDKEYSQQMAPTMSEANYSGWLKAVDSVKTG